MIIKGTKYSVVVDKPADPVQMFSMGNIRKETYSTLYTPVADIATEVEVQFVNKDKGYTRDQMSVQVEEFTSVDINSKKATLSAFGITSSAEAYRWGRYLLATSRFQRRMISFEADIDSIACTVGDVISFSHDVPQWGEGGRVVSSDYDNNTVTLDREITFTVGTNMSIILRYQDDTMVTLPITHPGNDTLSTIEVLNMPQVPNQYDVYTVGVTDVESKLLRVVSITRTDELVRKIETIEYNESIIDDDTTVVASPTPNIPPLFATVSDVVINEHLEKRQSGTIVPYLDISWDVSSELTAGFNI
jgi:predicted phage tail protein